MQRTDEAKGPVDFEHSKNHSAFFEPELDYFSTSVYTSNPFLDVLEF